MSVNPDPSGGCACGAVRYRLRITPFDAGYCHCGICRRTSGAPVMAFASVPFAAFEIIAGTPRRRRSSTFGERWFCADCGSPLAMRVDHQPETIDFTIASLDDPSAVIPAYHLFYADRIGWFDTADALPRHEGFRAGTRGLSTGGAAESRL
jgi:hypothetical protein